MRILQINSVYGYGSTGRIVENLHHSIQESGNESFVIYGRGEKTRDPNIYKIGNTIEQGIDLLATRLFNRHGQTNFFTTQQMIKKIEEIKPDIVHLHNLHGYYVNYIKLLEYLKHTEIKIVWLLHDPWIISGSSAELGGLNYDWEGLPNIRKLNDISNEYPKHSKWSIKQSHKNYESKKALLSNYNIHFVTPSFWLSKIIKDSYLQDNKIEIIHNAIDLEKFKYLGKVYDKNYIEVLGVASIWGETKGLNFFNQLAHDLDENHLITLVGVTAEQMKNIHPNINCIERTNSIAELVEIYNRADVFVNPTLYDNFPTVNLEAQACGTPVVTFDTGGSGESIDRATGSVIETRNYGALLQTIKKYNKKTKMTASNCHLNAKIYSLDVMLDKYLNLYGKILNGDID